MGSRLEEEELGAGVGGRSSNRVEGGSCSPFDPSPLSRLSLLLDASANIPKNLRRGFDLLGAEDRAGLRSSGWFPLDLSACSGT